MSKDNIRRILREDTKKTNILGKEITRPDQVLDIMRGIPGSGKSTEARNRVGSGVIHSTDDIIESMGDYREFFSKMISSGDFSPLSKAHTQNLENAKKSIQSGISPVIIDNTNIRPSEAKAYVEFALNNGLSEDNINFIEVGTGGVSAEELAKRNTHGVPLEEIKQMIQSYKSVGPMTIEKVINSKPMFTNKTKYLASLVLDESSHNKLLDATKGYIPEGWKIFAHHMTINFGDGLPDNLKDDLGKTKSIVATQIGVSDMAIAVKVDGYHSDNDIPHVTVAVNVSEGGKPVMSNNIKNWESLDNNINLTGIVTERKLG